MSVTASLLLLPLASNAEEDVAPSQVLEGAAKEPAPEDRKEEVPNESDAIFINPWGGATSSRKFWSATARSALTLACRLEQN